jgi:hypothetical protein
MNYCTNCGAKLEPNNKFCSKCGANVSGIQLNNPKLVKLYSNEIVHFHSRGWLKAPNSEWTGTPTTQGQELAQHFSNKMKYKDLLDENLELMICLTNRRFFIEPRTYNKFLFPVIKLLMEIASLNEYAKYKTEERLESQEELIQQARESGEPIFEIELKHVTKFFVDEDSQGIFGFECKGKTLFFFTVLDDKDLWIEHFRSLFKEIYLLRGSKLVKDKSKNEEYETPSGKIGSSTFNSFVKIISTGGSITEQFDSKYKLRKNYLNDLNEVDVKTAIEKYDFYCSYFNKNDFFITRWKDKMDEFFSPFVKKWSNPEGKGIDHS